MLKGLLTKLYYKRMDTIISTLFDWQAAASGQTDFSHSSRSFMEEKIILEEREDDVWKREEVYTLASYTSKYDIVQLREEEKRKLSP